MTGSLRELVAVALRSAPYCRVPGCLQRTVALDLAEILGLAGIRPGSAFVHVETRCAIHAGETDDLRLAREVTP